jgi:Fe2+ or Zn2+ uptake regulation protein
LDEEVAEKYSLGQLSARKTADVEEHLLVCDSCRQVVTVCDSFVAAMRSAAAKLRVKEKKAKKRVAGK